jgi:Kef-type K+ transport system membrane component KefB
LNPSVQLIAIISVIIYMIADKLPEFLLTGIAADPFVLKIVSSEDIAKLRFVDELALAYIAFAAGSELVVWQIKSQLKAIRYTTIGLVAITFMTFMRVQGS